MGCQEVTWSFLSLESIWEQRKPPMKGRRQEEIVQQQMALALQVPDPGLIPGTT